LLVPLAAESVFCIPSIGASGPLCVSPFQSSLPFGVGNIASTCISRLPNPFFLSFFRLLFILLLKLSGDSAMFVSLGVSNNPYPVPSVRCVDGASWNNKRLDFVTFVFQVNAHLLEYHAPFNINDSVNILSDDPPWPKKSDNSKHFRPEIAVVCCSFSLSGTGKRLAGEAACEEVNAAIESESFAP
jgi:hypothetical protein